MTFRRISAIGIGEAMIEMAPISGGMYRRDFAGDTFNTVWHMARSLGDRATIGYVTRVGEDRLSQSFVEQLTEDGLDTNGIGRDPERTMGLYLIELDGVERSFHYWRSRSAARRLADNAAWLDAATSGADLIHLSGITLAILPVAGRNALFSSLRAARQRGALVSFDPNIRPGLWETTDEMRETLAEAMSCCDIALPSFDDERTHWGDVSPQATVERFAAAGVPEIVVKNGPGDIRFRSAGVSDELPTPTVSGIKDTTGAGDAFNAGYLAARLVGSDPRTAIAHGQAMSAAVLRHHGARIAKNLVPVI